MTKPTATQTIYGPSDVAAELGVRPNVVTNYLARYPDTPTPAFITPDGRKFWTNAGLAQWRNWTTS